MVQPPARVFDDVPVLCGHRGSGRGVVGGQLENSLGSFRAAVAAGIDWVEVDVRLNAAGELVASHDPISEPPARDDLMRVEDLLEDLPPEIGVNLEIKTALADAQRPRHETTAARSAELAARARQRPLLLTSFDPSAPLIVRELEPQLPVGLLTWIRFPLRKAVPAAVHLGMDVVAPHVQSLQLEEEELHASIRTAHEAGLQVVGWCPDREQAERLLAARVDCLIVDDVPAAVTWWPQLRERAVFQEG
jgi:glycerophosphoryl diester phosphodiesterase